MTKQELEMHLAKLLDPDTGHDISKASAGAIHAAFTTLTAVPEDVARDEYNLRMSLRASLPEGVALTEMLAALSRLASAAARVPGLEAARKAYRKRAYTAESERASERQRVATLQDNLTQAVEAGKHERQRAERAWDTERQRAEEVTRITARVAELERELRKTDVEVATITEKANGAMARATAAEATVKALEKAIRAKADDYRASHGEDAEGPHPLVDWAERILRSASRPSPTPAGLREAVESFLSTLDATPSNPYPDETDPRVAGWNDALTSVREGAAPLRAAAYDATPPAVAHAHLAAVVEEVAKEEPPGTCADDSPMAYARSCGWTEGAREVLRRATGGEVRVPWSRSWKTLAKKYRGSENYYRDMRRGLQKLFDEYKEKAAKWDAAVGRGSWNHRVVSHYLNAGGGQVQPGAMRETVRWLLHGDASGTPPPSGPGGGERVPSVPLAPEAKAKAQEAIAALRARTEPAPRSRLAPTPTPDVPPLSPVPGLAMPPPAVQEAIQQHAQPEPAAPEVAWSGDGVRVLADGSCWFLWAGRWHLDDGAPAAQKKLATALAEAKRALEGMRGERDSEREIAQEWEQRALKAAEDMRERAKALALEHKAGFLAEAIGDLPLEDK